MDKNDDPTIPNYNNESPNIPNSFDSKSYNLSGKIMLCAIVLLFFVIVLMLCLHLYARWYLVQSRRRRNRLRRRSQLVFFTDNPTTTVSVTTSRGLDASVIAKLPLFLYDPETHPHPENAMECAVCLSEFEPGETGRVLPKCNHSFHTECIDMWFHSHSTCPLCRAPVETTFEPQPEVVITVSEAETGSGSGSIHGSVLEDENLNRTGKEICSSSVGLRRKPSFTGVTVEVPTRNEESCDSPSSFRSPMSRMLSFKRMLSREWKGSVVSPSSCGGGGGCSSVGEVNSKVEHGGRNETQ